MLQFPVLFSFFCRYADTLNCTSKNSVSDPNAGQVHIVGDGKGDRSVAGIFSDDGFSLI